MKRLWSLFVPAMVAVILVLSGCEKPGSAMWPVHSFSQPEQNTSSSLISSAALGSSFQQAGIPAGKAIVYIYRPTSPMFGADIKLPFEVKANGKVVTTLMQGGYYAYVSEPGAIEFTAFDTGFMAPTSVFSITVDAKAGQAYYLKGAHGKGMGGRAHLDSISPEEGAGEVAKCKVITAP